MLVDDHDLMFGGIPGAFTIQLSKEDVEKLLAGELIRGENQNGRKTRIIVMPEWIDFPGPTSAS